MVTIDVKDEKQKVNSEIQQMVRQVQELDQQVAGLNQRRQVVVNELIKRQGVLELLQKLDESGKLEEVKK